MIQPICYSTEIRKKKYYISVKKTDVISECDEIYTGYDKQRQKLFKRNVDDKIVSKYV